MGFDKKRFDTDVKEEFCCPICHDVLEDPIAINNCDHVFCSECIKNWLQHPKHKFCPMDREPTDLEQLRSPFRLFINLLFELKIRCEYEECNKFVQMSELNAHLQECPYNPSNKEKEIDCPKNCGSRIKLNENHDCIESMKKIIETLEQKLKKCQKELNEEKSNIEKIKKKFDKEIKEKDEKINLLKQEIETKNSIIEFSSDPKQSRKQSLQYTLPRLKKNSNQIIPPLIEFNNEQSSLQLPSSSQPSSPILDDGQQQTSSSCNITNSKFYDKSSTSFVTLMRSSNASSPPKESSSLSPTLKTFNNINGKESRVKSNVTFFNRMFNQNSNYDNDNTNSFNNNNNETIINNNSNINSNSNSNMNNNVDHFMDRCIRINIKQNVLSKVNRRHFYPNVNDDNKIVFIKKNVHSFTLEYELKLLEYIAPLIRSDSRVLDIGSGTSFLTCCLAQMSGFVVGVEIVPELVTKSLEIIQNYYRELQLCIVKSDGRFGCEKYAPYDLILIEPMIRTNIPDKLFGQLTPNGHIIAVINESKQSMKMVLMDSQRQVIKILNNDRHWLNENNKDNLIDPQNPETSSRNIMNLIYKKN